MIKGSSKLTNEAKEEGYPEDNLNWATVLHMILRPLNLPLNGSIPTIELFVTTLIAIFKATLTSLIACINSLST